MTIFKLFFILTSTLGLGFDFVIRDRERIVSYAVESKPCYLCYSCVLGCKTVRDKSICARVTGVSSPGTRDERRITKA